MEKRAAIESLTPAQAKREHARLEKEIAAHDRRYYTEDAPTISDAEYDALHALSGTPSLTILVRVSWGECKPLRM